MHTYYTFIAIAAAIIPCAAQPDNGSVIHTGQATYYNATGAGDFWGEEPDLKGERFFWR